MGLFFQTCERICLPLRLFPSQPLLRYLDSVNRSAKIELCPAKAFSFLPGVTRSLSIKPTFSCCFAQPRDNRFILRRGARSPNGLRFPAGRIVLGSRFGRSRSVSDSPADRPECVVREGTCEQCRLKSEAERHIQQMGSEG